MLLDGIYCREKSDLLTDKKISIRSKDHPDSSDGGEIIRCRFCRSRITSTSQMIEVNGGHHHTFANPHGKVFSIGCFAAAPGSITHGPASTDCTWFAGYSWRFSLCYNCLVHIGWKYESHMSGSFFGLILANLLFD